MDLEGIMLNEISQAEKGKYCMILIICGIYKNKSINITKQKHRYRYREQIGGYQRGGGWKEERNR